MNNIILFITRKHKTIVFIFFMIYLIAGLFLFKDYGVSGDEPISHLRGELTYNYLESGDRALFELSRAYGGIFDLFLVVAQKVLPCNDESRNVYFMRHLLTFLFFYVGVFFFYCLGSYSFKSWKMGLLGSLFLILSPRIFSHSFFNAKDIPCLAMFIVSIYTMIRYLDSKTLQSSVVHSLACALLINTRVVGVIVPFFTFVFFLCDLIMNRKQEKMFKRTVAIFLFYILLLVFFTVLSWPAIWSNPFGYFFESIRTYNS